VVSNKGEVKVLNISNGVTLKTLIEQQIKNRQNSDSSEAEEASSDHSSNSTPKVKKNHCMEDVIKKAYKNEIHG